MNGKRKDIIRLITTVVVIVGSIFLSRENQEVPSGVIEAVAGVIAYLLGVYSNNLPTKRE